MHVCDWATQGQPINCQAVGPPAVNIILHPQLFCGPCGSFGGCVGGSGGFVGIDVGALGIVLGSFWGVVLESGFGARDSLCVALGSQVAPKLLEQLIVSTALGPRLFLVDGFSPKLLEQLCLLSN